MRHVLTSLFALCALGTAACSNDAADDSATDTAALEQGSAPMPCTKAPCAERPVIWIHGHNGHAHDGDKILHTFTAPGERFDKVRYAGTTDHQDWAARSIPRREWLFSFDYYLATGTDANDSYTAGPGRIGSFQKLCADHESYDLNTTHDFSADFAEMIDDVLRATGASSVDVVAHSMGGLITRSVITFGGGRGKIANTLFLATPQKGVPGASLEGVFSDPPWMDDHELTELDRLKLTSHSDFRTCGEGGSSKTFTGALTDEEMKLPAKGGPTIHCMQGSKDKFNFDGSARYDRCVDWEVLDGVDHGGILQAPRAAEKAREVLGGTTR